MIKRSTLIIVGVFIVLLVVAVIVQQDQEKVETDTNLELDLSYLVDIGESEITALEINASDGSKVTISKDTDGHWVLVDHPDDVVDENRIESAVLQAGTMRTINKLEFNGDLDDLGLNQPKNWIGITLSNGEQKVAFIGNITPTNSGYYAYSTGVPVQVVDKFNIDGVLEILTEPPILTQPENEEIE